MYINGKPICKHVFMNPRCCKSEDKSLGNCIVLVTTKDFPAGWGRRAGHSQRDSAWCLRSMEKWDQRVVVGLEKWAQSGGKGV